MQHARLRPHALERTRNSVQRPDFRGRACWFRQPERPESEQNMGKGESQGWPYDHIKSQLAASTRETHSPISRRA